MNINDHVVSFMDLLDLDEEIIDSRLKLIMKRNEYSNKHLTSAIQLLRYKEIVNLQDDCDCDNNEEWEFAARLIKHVSPENIDNICSIVAITLGLNTGTLVNKSEHLLQQILSDIDLPKDSRYGPETPEQHTALLYFRISDSVLDTIIKKGEKLSLPFLELPVKDILHNADERFMIHFLTNSVPKLFEGISGFSILDKIWEHIKDLQADHRQVSLNVLSSLSNYYLPVADNKGKIQFESVIVYQYEFWDIINNGLMSTDPMLRKISIYLAKRALDCVMALNKHFCVNLNNNTIFSWDYKNKMKDKLLWDNFFILIDSLEEKQSNIVLPSLHLFGYLKNLGNWLNCAFNIGLRHDNTQVRLKCVHYRLEVKIKSQSEAAVLLEALNDINIYDNMNEYDMYNLKKKIYVFLSDKEVFVHILKALPSVKWSPVPFYHITRILSELKYKDLASETTIQISQLVIDILKVPCNIIAIRKAVFVNISKFVENCCIGMLWKDVLSISCILQTEICTNDNYCTPLNSLIANNFVDDKDKRDFIRVIFDSPLHIEFGLLYLENNPEDASIFIDVLSNKIQKVADIVSRQYSDKVEQLQDVIYIMQLYMKTKNETLDPLNVSNIDTLNLMTAREFKTILHYIHSLLSNNTLLTIDEMNSLCTGFSYMSLSINNYVVEEVYKSAKLIINDNDSVLETKVLAMSLINILTKNVILPLNQISRYEMLQDIIILTSNFKNKQSIGRLRNVFYEKSCEIVESLIKDDVPAINSNLKNIAEFVENVIECGGYGCLKFCLNIMNVILPCLLKHKDIKFDISQFISRMWKEIEELKSNNQYNPCIEEFVNLITHDVLLQQAMYNNVVIFYCNKIIEYGSVKTSPLFYLVKSLKSKDITSDHGQLIYVLCEILLYSPVPRKDQRIIENLVNEILQDPMYASNKQNIDIQFNFQIQYLSVLILTKITNKDILLNIEIFIKDRINEVFRNKQRYHGHSHSHRLLLTALQHLLLISALKPNDTCETSNWCIDLLEKLPHQPSVRICLEWYISLYFYLQKNIMNNELLHTLKNLPVTSQFMILYWTLAHKIQENICSIEEYEFVMDVLLSHTMGQMFNIRLYAQYLATKLYEINKSNLSKYTYTISLIEKTFVESAKDKNFLKLKNDYFVNAFDIVNDFTPSFIYYFLPKYCEINNNEVIDLTFVKGVVKNVNSNIENNDFFKKEGSRRTSDEYIFSIKIWKDVKCKVDNDIEELGRSIQKKYVPWKNMSDVNFYEAGKKKKSTSELIVVASLIDKLPNLGGMARTSEVFGVKTYIVDSLRHLQDKQFQGLSVSAERWIDVEEVRPGPPLKQYLLQKKAEGYSVVAAEQTSSSINLQSFKFPRKTLLLLGHEKEGIPCDLLPMMDNCVEIPQQGIVRSLNVHVTAAIFVWEYARQNIL